MKKNIFKLNILLYSLLSLVIFTACEDDDVVPEEEEEMEVITDVTLVFTSEQLEALVEAASTRSRW